MTSETPMTTQQAELEVDIAATRAQLGRTLEALMAKTHVKTRAKDAIREDFVGLKRRTFEATSRARDDAAGLARRVRSSARTRTGRLSATAVLAGVITALLVAVRSKLEGDRR